MLPHTIFLAFLKSLWIITVWISRGLNFTVDFCFGFCRIILIGRITSDLPVLAVSYPVVFSLSSFFCLPAILHYLICSINAVCAFIAMSALMLHCQSWQVVTEKVISWSTGHTYVEESYIAFIIIIDLLPSPPGKPNQYNLNNHIILWFGELCHNVYRYMRVEDFWQLQIALTTMNFLSFI